ncbi:hypothetical protein DYH09_29580 [bacterium CPR1]|nr:hypothetical protein [Propionibacteriaceae bacterium]MCE7874496.1 hypothetical protein [bacterium CPR1]
MKIVADSNTLIGLAKGEVFEVLRELYGEVFIPESVWDEVVISGAGRFGAAEALAARDEGWLQVQDPSQPGATADLTVLALARELEARLLTDDGELVRRATDEQVPTLGIADLVLVAYLEGLIPGCRDVFERMLARSFGVRDSLILDILRLTGERE